MDTGAAGPQATAIETPDQHGAYPRLTPDQINELIPHGERRTVARGRCSSARASPSRSSW